MKSLDQTHNTPKVQLLKWLNQLLEMNIKTIQQLSNGCVFMQLLDYMHSDQKVPLNKLNWKAKYENDNLNNLKLLDTWIGKLANGKKIDIEKIGKGRYQDNLDLLQWFKRNIDTLAKKQYSARQRRCGNDIPPAENIKDVKIKKVPQVTKPSAMLKKIEVEQKFPSRLHQPFCDEKQRKFNQIQTIVLKEHALEAEQKLRRISRILLNTEQTHSEHLANNNKVSKYPQTSSQLHNTSKSQNKSLYSIGNVSNVAIVGSENKDVANYNNLNNISQAFSEKKDTIEVANMNRNSEPSNRVQPQSE